MTFVSNVTNYERKNTFSFTKFSKTQPMKEDETGMKLKVEFFPHSDTTKPAEIDNTFTEADNNTIQAKSQECKTKDNKDCQFPFWFQGQKYSTCMFHHEELEPKKHVISYICPTKVL